MAQEYPNVATGALITHTAASAGVTGQDADGSHGNGLLVFVNISAISGTTPTLTVTVQGKDPVSGQYYTILASTALNAVAFTVLRIYPGLTAAANLTVNDVVPTTYRIVTAIGGTTPSVTATISAVSIG